MGNIVGKPFGVVASKDYKTALTESVKEGNQAKFYLTQNNGGVDQKALDDVTIATVADRNALVINGNTIQGISKNDLEKLDIISNTSKIFNYKGSVKTKEELLAKVPPSTVVGDVYNVEVSITLDGVLYPAHTNFVYTGLSSTGSLEKNWDSLGGTMQIGTGATRTKVSTSIKWSTEQGVPITEFYLSLGSGLDSSGDGVPFISISSGLKYDNDFITLHLATNDVGGSGTSLIGEGVSGLGINSSGGLHVILSSSLNGGKYLIHTDNGIALDYDQLVTSLKKDTQLETYINFLINAKLKAQ